MADLSISISFDWEERPGECIPCRTCNEPIYLKRYVAVVSIGVYKEELKISLCESCYNLIDDGGDV